MTVYDIASAIEAFAPLPLQESYDNAGMQVGRGDRNVNAVMLCLDVTAEVLEEAIRRQCEMIVSHHPLIFHGLKSLTGADETQRIVMRALEAGVAIYSAHTNLDSTWNGVSHEMAHILGLSDISVLEPAEGNPRAGLGVVGSITPTPKLEPDPSGPRRRRRPLRHGRREISRLRHLRPAYGDRRHRTLRERALLDEDILADHPRAVSRHRGLFLRRPAQPGGRDVSAARVP